MQEVRHEAAKPLDTWRNMYLIAIDPRYQRAEHSIEQEVPNDRSLNMIYLLHFLSTNNRELVSGEHAYFLEISSTRLSTCAPMAVH
jgi:hypothetical protein